MDGATIERIRALDLDHGKYVLVDLQLLHGLISAAQSIRRCSNIQMMAVARMEAAMSRSLTGGAA